MNQSKRALEALRTLSILLAVFAVGGCDGELGGTTENESEDDVIEVPALVSHRLHVDGPRLLDELGRQVVLRGFNVGSRAKMPPFLPFDVPQGALVAEAADAFFEKLEALGANAVRVTFLWEAFESTRGNYDTEYLARYTELLDAANAHGLAVIVDLHQDVFASSFCGDGFPLWALGSIPHDQPHYDCSFPGWSFPAFDPESSVSLAFHQLWNNVDGLADDMEAMWRAVASALSAHPAVAAFEILNEPAPGQYSVEIFDSEILPSFNQRMGTAIREEAGDIAVLWNERIGAMDNREHLNPPDLEGAVYAPHYYEPLIAVGLDVVQEDAVRDGIASIFSVADTWNMPVVLGEFGVPNENPAKAAYLDFVLDQADAHNGHALMWDASMSPELWNGEDFSVLSPDGKERLWADAVVRPFPRAVSGHIVAFSWDTNAARFDLQVEAAGVEVSLIYLPERHLGVSPIIKVRGPVKTQHEIALELLLVKAERGADYTITITPE